MKINIEENISTSEETIKNKNNKTELEKEEIEKNIIIMKNIKTILTKYKSTKQKEENTYNELNQYIKSEQINIIQLKDHQNYTIIQRFCLDMEDYFLSCVFFYLEKELNNDDFVKYLLKNDNELKMNIFEISSQIGEIKIFRILKKYLKDNVDLLKYLINNNNDGKRNIFHIAAEKNKIISLLFFFSFYYNNKIHNSILNIQNNSSQTPLHIVCHYGFYEFTKYLLDLGANFNSIDKENKTPLFHAVKSKSIKIIKYLIISGANKNIIDKKGMLAKNYSNDEAILDVLENKGCSDIVCKCKTEFKSIKNHHINIIMIILLIFFFLLHCYIIIKYKLSDFLNSCNYDIELIVDFVFLIINIIFELLAIIIYIFFQIIKTKQKNNNNNSINSEKFCIKENGIEYYEMFKYNENICVICKRVKEMNTKHCLACNACIDDFDHHCFFLNACIDKKNNIYFNIFLFEILTTICLNIILSIKFFIDLVKKPKIYYGLFLNSCDFKEDEYKFIDIIIYIIDTIYFLFCLFTILVSAIPIIIYLIKKKIYKNRLLLGERTNSPLLPIEDNNV